MRQIYRTFRYHRIAVKYVEKQIGSERTRVSCVQRLSCYCHAEETSHSDMTASCQNWELQIVIR
jgi:hypothetical protein